MGGDEPRPYIVTLDTELRGIVPDPKRRLKWWVGAGFIEAAAKLPLKRGRICIYWGVQLMGTQKQARSKLEKRNRWRIFDG